jgi:hypothetical protein
MLCRRCGMESSTTDVCEWCNRPMLPPGAAVSSKAGKELRKGKPGEAPPAPPPPSPSQPPLVQEEEAEQAEAAPEEPAAEKEESPEELLRPLGGGGAGAQRPKAGTPRPGGPSHGLSDDATQTSIDISAYVGDDQSIFRPLERGTHSTSMPGGGDPLARTRRRGGKTETVSEIPENTRLFRSVAAGVAICVVLAVIQTFVNGVPPKELHFAALHFIVSRRDSLLTGIMYGVAAGLLLGLGLGAILVKLKRGPIVGTLIGVMVGWGLQNPPWGFVAGALTGILAGRFATVGLRRVTIV